jgi:hypothetical protein
LTDLASVLLEAYLLKRALDFKLSFLLDLGAAILDLVCCDIREWEEKMSSGFYEELMCFSLIFITPRLKSVGWSYTKLAAS